MTRAALRALGLVVFAAGLALVPGVVPVAIVVAMWRRARGRSW